MSRVAWRLEPLPDPFVLPLAAASASPLHRRLVLLALPDDPEAARLFATLEGRAGWTSAASGSRLFTEGLDHCWAAFQPTSDVGLGPMLGAEEFLVALRSLADALLAPVLAADADARVLLEWSPEHATPASVAAMASVFPDAVIVVRADLAEQLPAFTRTLVQLDTEEVALTPAAAARLNAEPAASPLLNRLLIIVGCGRSGTTWLEQMLLAHPAVGGIERSESWLFHQMSPLWRNHSGLAGLSCYVDRDRLAVAIRQFTDAVFGAMVRHHRPGARLVVEKTPVHAYLLREIAAVYPDAWVVHLLRDGREVARSIAEVPFFQVPDPADAAALWQRVVDAVRRDAAVVPRFRDIRYEALAADPVRIIRELLEWVGLPMSGEEAACVEKAVGVRVSVHAGEAHALGAPGWRLLSRRSVRRIYRRAARRLVAEGYVSRAELWRTRVGLG